MKNGSQTIKCGPFARCQTTDTTTNNENNFFLKQQIILRFLMGIRAYSSLLNSNL